VGLEDRTQGRRKLEAAHEQICALITPGVSPGAMIPQA